MTEEQLNHANGLLSSINRLQRAIDTLKKRKTCRVCYYEITGYRDCDEIHETIINFDEEETNELINLLESKKNNIQKEFEDL